MGISIGLLEQILINRELFINKKVLSISVQYPPPLKKIDQLNKCMGNFLSNEEIHSLKKSTNSNFSIILFKEILKVEKFESVDISNEEGADYVFDLNKEYDDQNNNLNNKYDFVIEGGTMEHLSNNQQYLKNVFNFLKTDGYFFCSTPSSGYAEHGLYQFSPTFISDLYFKNKEIIKLTFLGLEVNSQKTKGLILNNFYKDNKFELGPIERIFEESPSLRKNYLEAGIMTGTLLRLAFSSNYKIMMIFIFQKRIDQAILDFNFNQYIYRNFSLENLSGKKNDQFKEKSFKSLKFNNDLIKDIFFYIPVGNKFKYNIIVYFNNILIMILNKFRKSGQG